MGKTKELFWYVATTTTPPTLIIMRISLRFDDNWKKGAPQKATRKRSNNSGAKFNGPILSSLAQVLGKIKCCKRSNFYVLKRNTLGLAQNLKS